MIRSMSSVVRTVQQNILKKPFSTSRVVRADFKQKLQKLEKEQLKAQADDTAVYIRDGKMYFVATCILGVVAGVLSFQSFSKVIRGN